MVVAGGARKVVAYNVVIKMVTCRVLYLAIVVKTNHLFFSVLIFIQSDTVCGVFMWCFVFLSVMDKNMCKYEEKVDTEVKCKK